MKKLITLFRILIILSGVIGLSFLFPDKLYNFTYYTNISGLLVTLFYCYVLFKKNQLNEIELRIKGSLTICIMLTFIVYSVLLAPKAKPEDFYHIKNYTLHYILPILTLIDWFAFDLKGVYKKFDPLLWTAVPLIYCVYSLIRGALNIPIPNEIHSPYPYFFVNINKYGWNSFFMYFSVILIIYIVLGYIMYFIKREKH